MMHNLRVEIFEPTIDPSKSLFPNGALVKENTSLVIPIDPFWFSNNKAQNVDGDQPDKVKVSLLPDLFTAKRVRHLDVRKIIVELTKIPKEIILRKNLCR